MNKLKISLRLGLLIGFMSALLLMVGGIGLYGVTKGDQALNTVYSQRTVPITLLSEIQYLQQAIQPTLAQLQANELFAANALMGEKVRPMFEVMREKSNALMDVLVQGTKKEYESSSQRNTVIRTVSLIALLSGLAIAVLFGWSLMKGITGPLDQAVGIANAVANGNLSQHIPTQGSDEISALLRALSSMQEGLVNVVSSVRKGSERPTIWPCRPPLSPPKGAT